MSSKFFYINEHDEGPTVYRKEDVVAVMPTAIPDDDGDPQAGVIVVVSPAGSAPVPLRTVDYDLEGFVLNVLGDSDLSRAIEDARGT